MVSTSPAGMPQPSSWIFSSRRPPPRTSTVIRRAPASSAFSTSSRTTDAGRSTTSPAAIWAATVASSTRMGIGQPSIRTNLRLIVPYREMER
jgi:hypothetical protein